MNKTPFMQTLKYGDVISKGTVITLLDGSKAEVSKVSEVTLSHLGKTFITGWCIPKEETK